HPSPLAGGGRPRMRGRLHELEPVESAPHPDPFHSPPKMGVNALMASGATEQRHPYRFPAASRACAATSATERSQDHSSPLALLAWAAVRHAVGIGAFAFAFEERLLNVVFDNKRP